MRDSDGVKIGPLGPDFQYSLAIGTNKTIVWAREPKTHQHRKDFSTVYRMQPVFKEAARGR
eukprot:2846482-Pyramimonas_sp.AAC.1